MVSLNALKTYNARSSPGGAAIILDMLFLPLTYAVPLVCAL